MIYHSKPTARGRQHRAQTSTAMLKFEDVKIGDLLVYESKEEIFWIVVLAIRPEERAMDIDVIVAGENAEIYKSDFESGLIFRP